MSHEDSNSIIRLLRARMILPTMAVIIFLAMVAIAEYQVRSSPKWPPPLRHEVGGWQVEDPPLWTLAAGLNLPATIPILWMSSISDSFTYALDDHHLIIYLPWAFLSFGCGTSLHTTSISPPTSRVGPRQLILVLRSQRKRSLLQN